jgi:hypothetical protein
MVWPDTVRLSFEDEKYLLF